MSCRPKRKKRRTGAAMRCATRKGWRRSAPPDNEQTVLHLPIIPPWVRTSAPEEPRPPRPRARLRRWRMPACRRPDRRCSRRRYADGCCMSCSRSCRRCPPTGARVRRGAGWRRGLKRRLDEVSRARCCRCWKTEACRAVLGRSAARGADFRRGRRRGYLRHHRRAAGRGKPGPRGRLQDRPPRSGISGGRSAAPQEPDAGLFQALSRIFPDREIEVGLLYTAGPRLVWLDKADLGS